MKEALFFSAKPPVLNSWLRTVVASLALWTLAAAAWSADTYIHHAASILAHPPESADIAQDIETSIFLALNSYRKSKGHKPLPPAGDDLVMAARAHAMDLLAMGKVGHVASTGHDFESRMRSLRGGGLIRLPSMSENAARDRRVGVTSAVKAASIMQQWIDSPRHRKSLTDRSYAAVAIGAVRRGDVVYAVQIFVGPETEGGLFGSQN